MPKLVSDRQKEAYWRARRAGRSMRDACTLAGFSLTTARGLEGRDRDQGGRSRRQPESRHRHSAGDPLRYDDLSEPAQRAWNDFPYFQRRYLGRKPMAWQEDAANKVVEWLGSPDEEYVVCNAPPGVGKTLLFTHDIPCWLIVRNRAIRILLGSVTGRLASNYTSRLRNTLEATIPLKAKPAELLAGSAYDAESTLAAEFGRFKPLQPTLWTKEAFTVAQYDDVAVIEKEPTVQSYGFDSEFIGNRVDFANWDDLVNPRKQRSQMTLDQLREDWDDQAECQPCDAIISLADGTFTTMGDVSVGDMVLGSSGPVRVTGKRYNGERPVLRVTTKQGRTLLVTENHPLYTPCGWVPADHAVGLGVRASSTWGPGSLDEDAARMLGYMAGDGNLTSNASTIRCQFSNADPGVLEDFCRIARKMGWHWQDRYRHGCHNLDLSRGSRQFFRTHGMAGHGALTKRVPIAVMRSGPEAALAFVGGFFDTDGSMDAPRGHVSAMRFRVISEWLLRDTQELLTRLGVVSTLSGPVPSKKGHPIWELRIRRTEAAALASSLVSRHTGVKAQRLLEWQKELRQTHFGVVDDAVHSVELVGQFPTWGIETEDHTYVTGGILTHNTRLEPSGLLMLTGQRLASNDLYRYALDKVIPELVDEETGEILESVPKYHHLCYPVHWEDRCDPEYHKRGAPAWPTGCLLAPERVPWRKVSGLKHNNRSYETVYQQKDVDPETALVPAAWVYGEGDFPGCMDRDRDRLEIPRDQRGNLLWQPPLFSAMTVDPSPTRYWGIQWWVYQASTELRYLIDLEKRVLKAPDFLEFNPDTRVYSGLLEEWWQTSKAIGLPITHLIVEINAAQRFLVQYKFFNDWLRLRGVQIVNHSTQRNKSDPEYGVWTVRDHWRFGRIRLPGKANSLGKLAAMRLIEEVTRYPNSDTTDQVMAHWFFEFNRPRLFHPDTPPAVQRRPSWLTKTGHWSRRG